MTSRRSSLVFLLLLAVASRLSAQAIEQEILVPAATTDGAECCWVAADGDAFVVGAAYDSTAAPAGGAAYVYRRDAATGAWQFEQQLLPSDPELGAAFGQTGVAIAGDLIVIGAPDKDESGKREAGAAYVFRRSAATGLWSEEQKLIPSRQEYLGHAGFGVAIAGTRIAVGVPGLDQGTLFDAGSVFVFRFDAVTSTWTEEQELVDPDAAGADRAGQSVATDGTSFFVGSMSKEGGIGYAGSVGVWDFNGTSWTQSQEITASAPRYEAAFGSRLAVRPGQLLIGAPFDGATGCGAAYLYGWNGTQWSEEQIFDSPVTGYYAEFGGGLGVDGDLIVIGAPIIDIASFTGAAWIWRRKQAGSPWILDQEIVSSDLAHGQIFAVQIAIAGGSIFCGAMNAVTPIGSTGAVYRFDAAELTLAIEPTQPAPGAPIEIGVHRGDPGDAFVVAIEDVNGVSTFIPVILDVFGTDHDAQYTFTAPSPSLSAHVGLRAWTVSNLGPVIPSDPVFVDV